MPLICFACPLCGCCFSMELDYMLDGACIGEVCPYCKKNIELTPDHVTAESCVQVINFDDGNEGGG